MKRDLVEKYGRYAMVVGASRGIGAEIADQLAQRGFNLVLIARNETELQARAETARHRHGVETIVLPADLSTPGAAEFIASQTEHVDIGLIVYNAAIGFSGAFWAESLNYYDSLLHVNVLTPFELIYRLAPRLMRQGRGGIVLVSSSAGLTAQPYLTAYSATKAWTTNFGLGIWAELRPYGVDVLTAIVGATDTPGLHDMMQAEFLAGTKLDSASDVAAEILASIGRHPSRIIGRGNRRNMSALRLLGINTAGRLMARIMAKLVYKGTPPQQPIAAAERGVSDAPRT